MNHRAATLRAALIAACSLAPLAAVAQTGAPASNRGGQAEAIEEVVVVARKQGETLLDAPATISVLQERAVQAANITSATQLSGIVPGLVIMQGTAGASAAVRGLGSTSADPGMESSVATFQDGVYLGHPRDYTMPVYDVAQIELIKGTQSTLLGKNTSLGAVSIISRKPSGTFGYDVTVTHSDGIGGNRLEAGVDAPLGGGFALRLAGVVNDEGGYVRNLYLGDKERRINDSSGRLVLTGPLGEKADLTFLYQHDDHQTDGHYMELLSDPKGVVSARAAALGQTNFEAVGNDRSYSGADGVAGGAAGPLQFDNQKGDRATLVAVAEVGRNTLTAQSAWVEWNSRRAMDLDFTRAQLLDLYDHEKNYVLSQEIRLASPPTDRLSWLAGVYGYKNNWRLVRAVKAQTAGGLFPFPGSAAGDLLVRTEAWSAFASTRYQLSDRFTLSAGLRYTDEDKTPTYQRASTGFFALASQSPSLAKTTLKTRTARSLDGDLGVQFRPNDRTMLYLTWSKGSKSGGFQSSPTTLGAAEYDDETAYTTELGAKFDLARRGYLTAALFDTRVDGFQVSRTAVVDGVAQLVISNGDIGARGAEFSGSWQVTPKLTLNGGVVYSDAKFTKDFGASGALVAYKNMRTPRAPAWSGSMNARYQTTLGDRLSLRIEGSAAYTGDADLQLRSTDPLAPIAKAHTLLDGQVAIADKARGWELALIGTNLGDKRFATFDTAVTAGAGAYYGTLNRPRVIALQLKVSR
jgi:outer membrane receptor protein involved in Fe transport